MPGGKEKASLQGGWSLGSWIPYREGRATWQLAQIQGERPVGVRRGLHAQSLCVVAAGLHRLPCDIRSVHVDEPCSTVEVDTARRHVLLIFTRNQVHSLWHYRQVLSYRSTRCAR